MTLSVICLVQALRLVDLIREHFLKCGAEHMCGYAVYYADLFCQTRFVDSAYLIEHYFSLGAM